MPEQKFKIKADSRTTYTVLEHQLYKPKWIEHFGSVELVKEFIKNYNRK